MNNVDAGVSNEDKWTPHKIELALWAKAVASLLGLDLGVKPALAPERKRRRIETEENQNETNVVKNGMKTRRKQLE